MALVEVGEERARVEMVNAPDAASPPDEGSSATHDVSKVANEAAKRRYILKNLFIKKVIIHSNNALILAFIINHRAS